MDRPHIIDGLPNPGTMPAPEPGDSTFTERCEYKLEIIPPKNIIQCRRADIVEKDGVEIARGYDRTSYTPGDDVSSACSEVQKVAEALWPTTRPAPIEYPGTPFPFPAPEENESSEVE